MLGRLLVLHPWLFCRTRQNHDVLMALGVAKTLTLGMAHTGNTSRGGGCIKECLKGIKQASARLLSSA